MKQKIKETLLLFLAFFFVGGVMGVMYGILTGIYGCYNGIVLVKNVLIMFLKGGCSFIILWSVIAVVPICIALIAKLFK